MVYLFAEYISSFHIVMNVENATKHIYQIGNIALCSLEQHHAAQGIERVHICDASLFIITGYIDECNL